MTPPIRPTPPTPSRSSSPVAHLQRTPSPCASPQGPGNRHWSSRLFPFVVVIVVAAGVTAAAWAPRLQPLDTIVPGYGGKSRACGVSGRDVVGLEGHLSSTRGGGGEGGEGGGGSRDGDGDGGDGSGSGGGCGCGGAGGVGTGEAAEVTSKKPQQAQQEQQEQQEQRLFSFDAPDGPSAPGIGHGHDHQQQQQAQQRERRPWCSPSDDPAYSCLLSRPPGSFRDEIGVYLSMFESATTTSGPGRKQQEYQEGEELEQREEVQGRQENHKHRGGEEREERRQLLFLSVKLVVPEAASSRHTAGGEGGGTAAGWASLGVSPNGRMAGPSEAVVGFVGGAAAEDGAGDSAAGVLRYRMDGYTVAAVTPLPARQQILIDHSVEITNDGTLVVRFKRPVLEPSALCRARDVCEELVAGEAAACATANDNEDDRVGCLDPREGGVVLLWAYGRGSWPSYHDATGAFILPELTLET